MPRKDRVTGAPTYFPLHNLVDCGEGCRKIAATRTPASMLPSQSGSEYFVWKNLLSLQEYQVMEMIDFCACLLTNL